MTMVVSEFQGSCHQEFPRVRFLIVSSVHDYRMARRGNIQALADGLRKAGSDVTFLSIRYSYLSLIKGDPRSFLWNRANRLEEHHGIQCMLWKTLLHPATT